MSIEETAMFVTPEENALVGALLLKRSLEGVTDIIDPSDFVSPDNRACYESMLRSWSAGEHFDEFTVASDVASMTVEDLQHMSDGVRFSGIPTYAHSVSNAADLRRLSYALGESQTLLASGGVDSASAALEEIQGRLGSSVRGAADSSVEPVTIDDILATVAAEPERSEWLIPGFLRRRWRIVVAGEEGIGKMVFLRQIGHCLAAGVHPFKPDGTVPPRRVLIVDVENPIDTIAEQTRLISNQLNLAEMSEGRLMYHSQEEGMNLAEPADRRKFDALVQKSKADLVIAGPLYKLARRAAGGRADWDSDAMDLINFFDDIRTRHNCALILEHHLVKSSGNPTMRSTDQGGSTMFRRWPEMSFSLVEDMDSTVSGEIVKLAEYRRARNESNWPQRIRRRPPGRTYTGLAWGCEWDVR